MKKTILLSTIIAASAGFAADFECSNTFGVLPVSHQRQYTLVAVPFVGYGSTSSAEVGVKINEIIKTSNLAVGDKIYASNGGSYDGWEIVAGANDTKVWNPIAKAEIDKLEVVWSSNTPSADVVALNRGDAFWLVRSNATKDNFYLMGESPSSEGKNVTVYTSDGNQLLANSSQSPLDLYGWGGDAAKWDMIIVPDEGGAEKTYVRKGDAWCTVSVNPTTKATTYTAVKEKEAVIPAGIGFIYKPSVGKASRTLVL